MWRFLPKTKMADTWRRKTEPWDGPPSPKKIKNSFCVGLKAAHQQATCSTSDRGRVIRHLHVTQAKHHEHASKSKGKTELVQVFFWNPRSVGGRYENSPKTKQKFPGFFLLTCSRILSSCAFANIPASSPTNKLRTLFPVCVSCWFCFFGRHVSDWSFHSPYSPFAATDPGYAHNVHNNDNDYYDNNTTTTTN